MRNALLGCATVFLAALVIGGLLVGYGAHRGMGVDAEAKVFADASLVAITTQWDVTALEARASPELLDATPEMSLERLFAQLQGLGTLIGNPGCQGQAFVSEVIGQAAITSGRFACDTIYAAGPARIEMNLVKREAGWKISGFHVDSDALMHPVPGVRL